MSSQNGPYRSGKTRFEIFIFVIYMQNMCNMQNMYFQNM